MQKIVLLLFVFSISFSLKSFAQVSYFPIDSCNFDSGICPQITVSTDTQNIFQIGAPHKLFFGNAYSQPNAIMTDSIHPYKKNNFSYFDIGCRFVGTYVEQHLSFNHKYQTDTMKDGGYILISIDSGKNWLNISKFDSALKTYLGWARGINGFKYDTTFKGSKFAFTGTVSNWMQSDLAFIFTMPSRLSHKSLPFNDSIIFRFCFESDSIDNQKAGWIIDNIHFDSQTLCIEDIHTEFPITISPNPSSTNFNLTTNEIVAGKGYDVSIANLLGEPIFSKNDVHQANFKIDTQQFPTGIYFLKMHCSGYEDANKKLVVEK